MEPLFAVDYYSNWNPFELKNEEPKVESDRAGRHTRETPSSGERKRSGMGSLLHGNQWNLQELKFFSGRLLPEHVDLGLRLTVGEDVLQKPFLESSLGDGKFPEANKSGRSAGGLEDDPPYYPSLTAGGNGLLPGTTVAS